MILYLKTLAAGDFLSDGEDNLRLRPGLDVHLILQQMSELLNQNQQLPVPRTYNIQVKSWDETSNNFKLLNIRATYSFMKMFRKIDQWSC
jgi:hypothetical protein